MADPALPILETDLRFEERSGCLVLVDPLIGDVAAAWPGPDPETWRWRDNTQPAGTPYPSGDREKAMEGMVSSWLGLAPHAAERLAAQRGRFSFGYPQIVKR